MSGYVEKYKTNKRFFSKHIDRNEFPGWYATAVYLSVYHMICAYYHKHGISIPRGGGQLCITEKLVAIESNVIAIENKARTALYGGLDTKTSDLPVLDAAFATIESFMVDKIS